jgi:NADH-quinone oxidoreductase subunit C
VTGDEVVERVRALLGADLPASTAYATTSVDVPREQWAVAAQTVKDDPALGLDLFDLLTAVDELDEGFVVVLRLWSAAGRHALLLRTRVPRDDARLPTLTGVFAGAGWHERQLWEMFGVVPEGHPHLVPLLLPDGFLGTPLRKDFVLAARVAKAWPGAKEPGESDADVVPGRRRTLPPGVPAPGTWPAP